jgi:hypothetical protein
VPELALVVVGELLRLEVDDALVLLETESEPEDVEVEVDEAVPVTELLALAFRTVGDPDVLLLTDRESEAEIVEEISPLALMLGDLVLEDDLESCDAEGEDVEDGEALVVDVKEGDTLGDFEMEYEPDTEPVEDTEGVQRVVIVLEDDIIEALESVGRAEAVLLSEGELVIVGVPAIVLVVLALRESDGELEGVLLDEREAETVDEKEGLLDARGENDSDMVDV